MALAPEIPEALDMERPGSTLRSNYAYALPLAGPPCARCRHWAPAAYTDERGSLSEYILCHKPDGWFRDFQCFEPRVYDAVGPDGREIRIVRLADGRYAEVDGDGS